MNRLFKKWTRTAFAVGVLLTTLACALSTQPAPPETVVVATEPAGENVPQVSLSAPVEGVIYAEDVPVNILARVTNAGPDIDRVEIVVDNEVVSSVTAPNPAGAPVFTVAQNWSADGSGPRTIGLTVFRADGTASQTTSRTIQVEGEGPVPSDMVMDPAMGQDTSAPAPSSGEGINPGNVLQGLFGGNNNAGGGEAPASSGESAEEAPASDDESAEEAAPPTDPPPPTTPPEPTTEPTDPPPPTPSTPRATTTVGVNVRGGPSTAFATIGSFAPNTETGLLGVTSAGDWYKVEYYNGEGWIAANLLNVTNAEGLPIDDGPPLPTDTPVPPTATPVPTAEPSNRNLTFDDADQGFTPYPPECGDTMTVTLRLRNTGSESLGTGTVAIVRDVHIDSGTTTTTTVPVPDIGPGESVEVGPGFLTVDTNFDSRHRLEIVLDPEAQITESDEDDNTFSGLEYTLDQGSC